MAVKQEIWSPSDWISSMAAMWNGESNTKKHQESVQIHSEIGHVDAVPSAIAIGNRLLHGLLSFVTGLPLSLIPRRGRPVRLKARHELHPLAYLDALRGCLALIIFGAHTMPRHWKWFPNAVYWVPWFQFPFYGGFAALDIFFWISGYVTTYKIVGLMQTKQSDKLIDTLASTVFRRYFRLFLPILPVTLFAAIAVKTGLAIPPEKRANVVVGNPIWWWIKDSSHVMNPFTFVRGSWDGGTGSALIDVFWSLGTEFRSSMIICLFCVATCKMSTKTRKTLIWLCVPPFISWQVTWCMMGFLGMWFAECRQEKRLLRSSSAIPTSTLQDKPSTLTTTTTTTTITTADTNPPNEKNTYSTKDLPPLRQWALIALFLYSFIVMQNPYDTDKMRLFPHNILNLLVPDFWWAQSRMHMHLCIGAIMMLYPLDQVALLQRPLLTPFAQYLGELSFGIFAVHFPVSWIVWDARYVRWAMDRWGDQAMNRFWVTFPGFVGMTVVVLWAAEAFRRMDWQVVRLCKFLEDRLFE